MKYLHLNKLIIALCYVVLAHSSSYAQVNGLAEYKFLYTLPVLPITRTPPTVVQLMSTNLQGNETLFSPLLLDGLKTSFSISPDFSKLSVRNQTGDLIILGMNGDVINQYTFDTPQEEQWNWVIRGWNTPDSLILSQLTDTTLLFYELDLNEEPLVPRELESWNTLLSLDIVQLGAWDRCFCELLRFSPDFHYLMTPLLTEDHTLEDTSNVMLSWDLQSQEVTSFPSVLPWWLTTRGFPSWSHNAKTVIFGMNEEAEPGLYLYNYEAPPNLLYEIQCEACSVWDYTWSPNDNYITLWEASPLRSEPSYLVNIDMASGHPTTLLSGDYSPSQLYWSPDERYIAFGADDRELDSDPYSLDIVDVESGTLTSLREINTYSTLIGWIYSS